MANDLIDKFGSWFIQGKSSRVDSWGLIEFGESFMFPEEIVDHRWPMIWH
jgi:hypothetical protein